VVTSLHRGRRRCGIFPIRLAIREGSHSHDREPTRVSVTSMHATLSMVQWKHSPRHRGRVKLIITTMDRFGSEEGDDLGPTIDNLYAADDTARYSARKMLASLKDWVDAAHFYHHEPGTDDCSPSVVARRRSKAAFISATTSTRSMYIASSSPHMR